MSIRPPRALAPKTIDDNPLNAALEHEVLAEKAATYGRLLARLETALQALREFEGKEDLPHPLAVKTANARESRQGGMDAGIKSRHDNIEAPRPVGLASLRPDERAGEDEHDALLAEAGEALWHVVIQRELCGLRNHELFYYRDYRVPAAVRLRMGLRAGPRG